MHKNRAKRLDLADSAVKFDGGECNLFRTLNLGELIDFKNDGYRKFSVYVATIQNAKGFLKRGGLRGEFCELGKELKFSSYPAPELLCLATKA